MRNIYDELYHAVSVFSRKNIPDEDNYEKNAIKKLKKLKKSDIFLKILLQSGKNNGIIYQDDMSS